MLNTVGLELIIVATIVILFFILAIKPLRELGIWFTTEIVIPAMKWFLNYCCLYMLKLTKDILLSHAHIIRNIIYPRSIIFVNLDDQRKARDKAMNRKKGT